MAGNVTEYISKVTKDQMRELLIQYQNSMQQKGNPGYYLGKINEDGTKATLVDGTTVDIITKGLPGTYAPVYMIGGGKGLVDQEEPYADNIDQDIPVRLMSGAVLTNTEVIYNEFEQGIGKNVTITAVKINVYSESKGSQLYTLPEEWYSSRFPAITLTRETLTTAVGDCPEGTPIFYTQITIAGLCRTSGIFSEVLGPAGVPDYFYTDETIFMELSEDGKDIILYRFVGYEREYTSDSTRIVFGPFGCSRNISGTTYDVGPTYLEYRICKNIRLDSSSMTILPSEVVDGRIDNFVDLPYISSTTTNYHLSLSGCGGDVGINLSGQGSLKTYTVGGLFLRKVADDYNIELIYSVQTSSETSVLSASYYIDPPCPFITAYSDGQDINQSSGGPRVVYQDYLGNTTVLLVDQGIQGRLQRNNAFAFILVENTDDNFQKSTPDNPGIGEGEVLVGPPPYALVSSSRLVTTNEYSSSASIAGLKFSRFLKAFGSNIGYPIGDNQWLSLEYISSDNLVNIRRVSQKPDGDLAFSTPILSAPPTEMFAVGDGGAFTQNLTNSLVVKL